MKQPLDPSQNVPKNNLLAVVSAQNISIGFGQVQVLEDVSFEVQEGEFVAIIGPNGAGKSTLIKIALGLKHADKGKLILSGSSGELQPADIGYVPQLKTFDRTFPATVIELVVSGLRQNWVWKASKQEKEVARQALADVGAGQLEARGLASLSGGELQRVYLARAMVREPKIIFLDEPATGVDTLAEHDLYHLLENYLKRNPSAVVVMITHDLSVARFHADKVLVLNRRLYNCGDPEEVMTEECLKEAFGHQGHHHSLKLA